MKILRLIFGGLLMLGILPAAHCQQTPPTYPDIVQEYYHQPHPQLVDLLITHLNEMTADSLRQQQLKNQEPTILAFFSALNTKDAAVKTELAAKLGQIISPRLRSLMQLSLTSSPQEVFDKAPLSPAYNDMAWSAYFATGDTHYLDLLLANCHHAAERHDRNLFFTGASARWSLCSVAHQDATVRAYLASLPKPSQDVKALLKADPDELKQEMFTIYAQYQKRGSWH
jgi:hypothetical protein